MVDKTTRLTLRLEGREYRIEYWIDQYAESGWANPRKRACHRMRYGDLEVHGNTFEECSERMNKAITKKYQL